MKKSALQKARATYQPKLPIVLTGAVKAVEGDATQSVADQEEIKQLAGKSASYTEKIEKARSLPGEILEKASIPIQGLSVENGVPLINGLPVSNLSEGEKLDLCIDVAIQNHGGLQIILIDGVEKLSAEMRQRLYSKCREKDLQFISTRTTDSRDLMVIEL